MAGETIRRGARIEDVQSKRASPPPDCDMPEYLPASWKGTPFLVLTSSDDFGRRGDSYEYPLQENVGYVDLGRKARRFKIEGYLIGSDQVAQTKKLRDAAEQSDAGILVHPMYGPQMVACITLSCSADYRRDKKRTKLAFDFIEAVSVEDQKDAPQVTPHAVFKWGTDAWTTHKRSMAQRGAWGTNPDTPAGAPPTTPSGLPDPLGPWGTSRKRLFTTLGVWNQLAEKIKPARDEASWDAVDQLQRRTAPQSGVRDPSSADQDIPYLSFDDIADPIGNGTGTVRRLWGMGGPNGGALARLRAFNGNVVALETQSGDPLAVEPIIVTSRLALIRDFATAAVRTQYTTKNQAFADLDFIMRVYDDEEFAAAAHCWDDLVVAIRSARAVCASAMLATNIRLPGVFITNVDGVWPSLVVAHKLYADGKRFQTVEDYNTSMPPFFIGRDAVAPAQ